jgi:adenosylcobinamide-phosphate synthase
VWLLIYCYIADLIFGDPEWFPHPVRGMGTLITLLDRRLCSGRDKKWKSRMKGMILTFIVVGISVFLSYLFIRASQRINLFLGSLAQIYLGYTTLSVKDLSVKARAIFNKLEKSLITEARSKLSHIVGRDTHTLSEEKIVKAAVESIAENTNDGIVAPLFYLALGGPVLAIAYKAINTLDSMVGYRNKRYIDFGWFSARLDDVANFIPARITGLLIAISSFILGHGFKSSLATMCRDGKKHASPNSGLPESAMAGALGVKIGGPCTYQGKFSDKPYFGEDKTPIRPSLINEALRISFVASFLMLLGGVAIKCAM